jgi:ferredoxin
MKMKIDQELCTGHGRCAHYAPSVFRLDDDGYNSDRGSTIDVPEGEEKAAAMGMKSCPEKAITIIED